MSNEPQNHESDEEPRTDELEEPSTEKDPGEEPEGGAVDDEADHEAVGIGVVGSEVPGDTQTADPATSPEGTVAPRDATSPEVGDSSDAHADDDLPTDAVTDDVKRASAESA